jgi:hypothetical protein
LKQPEITDGGNGVAPVFNAAFKRRDFLSKFALRLFETIQDRRARRTRS